MFAITNDAFSAADPSTLKEQMKVEFENTRSVAYEVTIYEADGEKCGHNAIVKKFTVGRGFHKQIPIPVGPNGKICVRVRGRQLGSQIEREGIISAQACEGEYQLYPKIFAVHDRPGLRETEFHFPSVKWEKGEQTAACIVKARQYQKEHPAKEFEFASGYEETVAIVVYDVKNNECGSNKVKHHFIKASDGDKCELNKSKDGAQLSFARKCRISIQPQDIPSDDQVCVKIKKGFWSTAQVILPASACDRKVNGYRAINIDDAGKLKHSCQECLCTDPHCISKKSCERIGLEDITAYE